MTTQGNPLGLLGTRGWIRDEDQRGRHRDKHRQLPFEEKESVRWLQVLQRSTADLPVGTTALTVAGRESDIFEFLLGARELGQPVLIRATSSRPMEPSTGGPRRSSPNRGARPRCTYRDSMTGRSAKPASPSRCARCPSRHPGACVLVICPPWWYAPSWHGRSIPRRTKNPSRGGC